MDPQIKAQWVAALRSGEYKQGAGQLHAPATNSYCCLGVLCDLAVKAGLDITVTTASDRDLTYYNDDGYELPDSVKDWAGLEENLPEVDMMGLDCEVLTVAALNDDGTPFGEIADIIERDL